MEVTNQMKMVLRQAEEELHKDRLRWQEETSRRPSRRKTTKSRDGLMERQMNHESQMQEEKVFYSEFGQKSGISFDPDQAKHCIYCTVHTSHLSIGTFMMSS